MGIDFRRPRHIRGFRLGEVLVWDFMSKPLVEKTVSGSVVAFFDGADAVLLKSCAVTIVPNLDGVSSVDVVQTGKNLIDWVVSATAFEFILPSGTYTFSVPSGSTIESGNWYFRGFDENGNPYTSRDSLGLSRTWIHATGSHWNYSAPTLYRFTFTIPEGCSKLEIFKQNENGNIPAMIEYGSTSTDYEPYVTPTTHTANLGRTIYGGQADVVAGSGESTHAKISDFSTLRANGTSSTGAYRYIIDVSEMGDYNVGACVSNLLNYRVSDNANVGEFYNTTNVLIIFLAQDNATDAINYLSSNLCKVAYPLATPETFTFDPVPIDSKLGNNTLWSEQGSAEVTYRGQGTVTVYPNAEEASF